MSRRSALNPSTLIGLTRPSRYRRVTSSNSSKLGPMPRSAAGPGLVASNSSSAIRNAVRRTGHSLRTSSSVITASGAPPTTGRTCTSGGVCPSLSLPVQTISCVLLVIHDMPSDVHALVQDPHYEHTFLIRYVKHDVRSIFIAPQVGRESAGVATKHGLSRKVPEAFMHSVQVSLGLGQSEIGCRILMDSTNIHCRFPGQPIGGHRSGAGLRLPP